MPGIEFERFLKTVLPELGLNWKKFRDDTFQKRIARRLSENRLRSFDEYRSFVHDNRNEQRILQELLTVTISSFFRDYDVYKQIMDRVMPDMISKTKKVRIWCAGCAGGEEAYSLAILIEKYYYWVFPNLTLTATDVDEDSLARAKGATFSRSSLKEVPDEFRMFYFKKAYDNFEVAKFIREKVKFLRHNLYREGFLQKNHLVFCRNSVYTYCTREMQVSMTKQLYRSLLPGGYLVLGKKEALGNYAGGMFKRISDCIYRKNA
jgi:chemotaxis methyl-accepting protein methylase